jgi:hypothetical protein
MAKKVTRPNLDPDWIKLEFYLPVNDQFEINAAKAVIAKVRKKYNGATNSLERPAVFRGWFQSKTSHNWMADHVCLLLVYVKLDATATKLDAHVELICDYADECYFTHTRKTQEEIWCLVSGAMQFTWKTTRKSKKKETDSHITSS